MRQTIKSILSFMLCTCFILTACKKESPITFPGYIEGKFIYISAYYSGVLQKINVNPGDKVEKGQPLFTLEPFPEEADLLAADATVQQAMDEKSKSEANYLLQSNSNKRNLALFKKEVISKEELEKSIDDYQSARANKKAAQANLLVKKASQRKAAWVAKQKSMAAPIDALIFDTYYSEHEKVLEGKPVMALLKKDAAQVVFFIPENLLGTIQLKQMIEVVIDGSSEPVKAQISYISPKVEYTPPIIFSENERQNLVFRVEAIPAETGSLKLHPGQPVTVHISTLKNHSISG